MEKLTRMSEEILKAASLEQLLEAQARGGWNPTWKRRLAEEIEGRKGLKPGEVWPFDQPVSPYPPVDPMAPPTWKTKPGTPERFDEEDEAIHGRN